MNLVLLCCDFSSTSLLGKNFMIKRNPRGKPSQGSQWSQTPEKYDVVIETHHHCFRKTDLFEERTKPVCHKNRTVGRH